MLCLHKEFLEVKWPDSQEWIFTSSNTEGIVNSNRVYSSVVCLELVLVGLFLVIDLINHSMLGSNEHSFHTLVFILVWGSESMLEVKACKNSISGVVVKYNSRASDVSFFFDSPKPDVLFATRCKPCWVDWAELQAQNVEFWSLFGNDFWLLTTSDLWNVVNYNELSVMIVLTAASQISAIMGETKALNYLNRHQSKWNASCCGVFPDSDECIASLLGWSKHGALHINVKAADWCRVTKEETNLLVGFRIHSNHGTSRCENNHIFSFLSWPLHIHALFRLVPNYVLQLHDWIFVKLVRLILFVAAELASFIFGAYF